MRLLSCEEWPLDPDEDAKAGSLHDANEDEKYIFDLHGQRSPFFCNYYMQLAISTFLSVQSFQCAERCEPPPIPQNPGNPERSYLRASQTASEEEK